jgi:uncharacterized membrane protein YphA (DoxX/SURF4 family)
MHTRDIPLKLPIVIGSKMRVLNEYFSVIWSSVIAALLINAGIAKMVSPGRFRQALRELVPGVGYRVGVDLPRIVAGVEVVAAVGLLVSVSRPWAAVVVATLGAGFILLGTAGWMRRSAAPCGCFGLDTDKPLGLINVAFGIALISLGSMGGLIEVDEQYSARALVLTSIGSVALCLWLKRRLVVRLLIPSRAMNRSEVR